MNQQVIHHHGHSASGGHYKLDVLHPNRYPRAKNENGREGWVRIDHELVSDVGAVDVFEPWERERDEMRNVYLLFYRRIRDVEVVLFSAFAFAVNVQIVMYVFCFEREGFMSHLDALFLKRFSKLKDA